MFCISLKMLQQKLLKQSECIMHSKTCLTFKTITAQYACVTITIMHGPLLNIA